MILICYLVNSTFSINLQNNKHWSQALLESLRSFLPLSTEKPLIIFKYVFQQPRSKGSRREPWKRGWSFSYTILGDNRSSRTRFSDSRGCRKKQAKRKWDARFSYIVSTISARGLGRQFLKSPGNFLVPKSNSQTKRRSRCLPVYEICKVSSQQNSVTSPQYAVTFARKESLEQSTIGSTKWTRRHGARALIPVGKRFLIELYSRPRGGDEMSEQIFWTDKKICPFSEQLLISQIMICASL